MKNDELIKKFEKEFAVMKKELKFKTSLDELDDVFHLRDRVLKNGYIPRHTSRMVCSVMVERLREIGNYLHSLVVPNPQSMFSLIESELFEEKKKEEFKKLMSRIMFFSSASILNELKKDRLRDGRFIDEAMKFWKETCKPKLIGILESVNADWGKRASQKG